MIDSFLKDRSKARIIDFFHFRIRVNENTTNGEISTETSNEKNLIQSIHRSAYLILINEELYGLKSRFHMHGLFFLRSIVLLLVSIMLDERLRIDDRLPVTEEMEFCRESVDFFSDFSEDVFPPVKRERSD